MAFNGLLASACYLCQTLVCLLGSWATDLVISRGLASTLAIRKLNTVLGLWVPGVCALLAVAAGCRQGSSHNTADVNSNKSLHLF